MAVIAVKPFVMKDVLLKIKDGATDVGNYEGHVSKVVFEPNAPTATWRGLTPTSVYVDVAQAEWVCSIDLAQDWETTNSLSAYLLANPGKQVTLEFTPKNGTTPKKATATAILVPSSIGGGVGEFATSSVSLPVVGAPAVA